MSQIVLQSGTMDGVAADSRWLGEAELALLDNLKIDARRRDWLLGRWLAKLAVLDFLGEAVSSRRPADIEILPAKDGAPRALCKKRPLPVALSLSHRGGHGLCAVAARGVELGCDLELVEPHSDALPRDYFTTTELERLQLVPRPDRHLYVTLVWSAKESALKALRQGLRLDTRKVEVEAGELCFFSGWHRLAVHYRDRDLKLEGWWQRQGDLLLTVVSRPHSLVPPILVPPAELLSI